VAAEISGSWSFSRDRPALTGEKSEPDTVPTPSCARCSPVSKARAAPDRASGGRKSLAFYWLHGRTSRRKSGSGSRKCPLSTSAARHHALDPPAPPPLCPAILFLRRRNHLSPTGESARNARRSTPRAIPVAVPEERPDVSSPGGRPSPHFTFRRPGVEGTGRAKVSE